MTRLPLWKLSRNPVSRAIYDRLTGRGLQFASLELYRRAAADPDSNSNPGVSSESTAPPAGDRQSALEWTVRESVDSAALPYRADEASEADLFVLARDAGEVIGQVFLTREEPYVHELETTLPIDGGYVWRLYVDPDYRNRGVGSQLLARAIEAARDRWRRRDLYALIADDNLPSRRLFEGQGFVPESRFRYARLGPVSRRWHSTPT